MAAYHIRDTSLSSVESTFLYTELSAIDEYGEDMIESWMLLLNLLP